jgi:hypothetical protein
MSQKRFRFTSTRFFSEGETFCVNSQFPYLTAIFSFTNLLNVRYYTPSSHAPSRLEGSFTVPGEFGGVDFSEHIGSLAVESVLDGPLNFSLFVWCHGLSSASNLDPDEFTIRRKFGENRFLDVGSSFCVWYTERRSRFSVSNFGSRVVQICRKSQCTEPHEAVEFLTSDNYLVVTQETEEFMEETKFRFAPRERRAPLKISELLYPTGE